MASGLIFFLIGEGEETERPKAADAPASDAAGLNAEPSGASCEGGG